MEENNSQAENLKKIPSIRTYTSDMADAVRENEASVIKIALAEQKKREQYEVYKEAEGNPKSKKIWIIGGIILLLISFGIIYFLLSPTSDSNTTQTNTAKIETYINYDNESFLDLSNMSDKEIIINKIREESSKVERVENIKSIFLTLNNNGKQELMSLSKMIELLGINMPGSLERSLGNSYMIGVYQGKEGDGSHMFMVFKTSDYGIAFAGMLEWEKTITSDLFSLFNIDVSGNNTYILDKPFKDIIINNKDARILYDNTGKNLMYYVFLNKNYIVITDSIDTIKEINNRLSAKNAKPL